MINSCITEIMYIFILRLCDFCNQGGNPARQFSFFLGKKSIIFYYLRNILVKMKMIDSFFIQKKAGEPK